jgi:4-hydroxybenzoate polyprenyltransferase
VFAHAIFLFLLISMRELTKDLENIKGDLALNYRTVPVVYGERISKLMLTVVALLTLVSAIILILFFEIGHMYYFFYLSIALLVLYLILLLKSNNKTHYLILHNILKFIIVAGVFSILLIDVSIVLNRI